MMIDDQPYKVWKLDDLGPAGVDLVNDLMKVYDLGYEIEFQLPTIVDNVRQIVPLIYNLNDVTPAEDEKSDSIKDIVGKIFKPADVPIFEKFDQESAVLGEQCGVTDEFMEAAKANIDSSPVAFCDEVPKQEPAEVPCDSQEPVVPTAQSASVSADPVPESDIQEMYGSEIPPIPSDEEFFPVAESYDDIPPIVPAPVSSTVESDPFSNMFAPNASHPVQPIPSAPAYQPEPVASQPVVYNPILAAAQPVHPASYAPEPYVQQPAPVLDDEMAYCINGHQTPKRGKFCIHCGARVIESAPASPQPDQYDDADMFPPNIPVQEPVTQESTSQSPSSFLASYLKQKR